MVENRFPIVAIGASAGGIPAMEAFFHALGFEQRMAFVIVTHLSPDRASKLNDVIAHQTKLPVTVAKDGIVVKPGYVYVMPEGSVLTIADGTLRLIRETADHHERRPIDRFFTSLASDQREYAIGIVLSGGDSDGTLGVQIIKENGGITFAQTLDDAGPRNPEMPESAIATGLVDFAIPSQDMPEKLQRLVEDTAATDSLLRRSDGDDTDLHNAAQEIARLLRNQTGQDFSRYKNKTFFRRVARRMQVTHDRTVEGYIERLRENPVETMALFRDLLINVTEFFRDHEAFDALQATVIPKLFEGRGADETVRIWVPGCSTGEEAYSIAILLAEKMDKIEYCPRVQLFATDIDDRALAAARSGRYPLSLLSKVCDSRRKRFFRIEGNTATVAQELRDLCVFSLHNITSDPPFSRMDLLSCRNLLIYFGKELQDQVIPTFHYALKPGGFLFLGLSESISQHSDLFAPVDQKRRIFQSRGFGTMRQRLPIALRAMGTEHVPTGGFTSELNSSSLHLKQRIEARVLEKYAPAYVVVRQEGDIVYYSARTSPYLDMPRGAPSRQLWDLARSELRLELRSAFSEAAETDAKATTRAHLPTQEEGHSEAVEITVEPFANHENPEKLFLVLFTPGQMIQSTSAAGGPTKLSDEDLRTEREMRDMRERMQATVEEYETALEELRSSNEELLSVNEEAQSTNEELEASKEEMQSLNEELTTINGELNDKLFELDRANADLRNLYEATQIATVFLDERLVIRNFTPAAAAFFQLRDGDIGRPLTELASALQYPELRQSIQKVFDTGKMQEHKLVPQGNGDVFLVRLVPYRNQLDRTTGVVVTLVDISNLAKAEANQRVLIEELNHRVKNMLAVVISISKATWRNTQSAGDFIETFSARLQSMARAHTLLSGSGWTIVLLSDLLGQEMAAYEGRVTFSGPSVQLGAEMALALSLVVHELGTNAAKYGALSANSGKVEIQWSEVNGALKLLWRETGGPEVSEPDKKGFGLVLLEGQISKQLNGTINFDFSPSGLAVELNVPLAS